MEEPFETIDYRGQKIKLFYDSNPQSPRDWENLGTMVCFHKRYELGDKTDFNSDNYEDWNEVEYAIRAEEAPIVILPLYLYDHSGISIRVGSWNGIAQHAAWDSGQVGFVYVSAKKALKWFKRKKVTAKLAAKVEDAIREEVKIYNKFITGDVCGFVATVGGEEIDSCWGFFDTEDAIDIAKESIDYQLKELGKTKEFCVTYRDEFSTVVRAKNKKEAIELAEKEPWVMYIEGHKEFYKADAIDS